MPPRKTTHGGRRSGAGRKRLAPDGKARSPSTVWLSPAERKHCEQLAGSVSGAVQLLLARSMGS